jgi:hypothetical protein
VGAGARRDQFDDFVERRPSTLLGDETPSSRAALAS